MKSYKKNLKYKKTKSRKTKRGGARPAIQNEIIGGVNGILGMIGQCYRFNGIIIKIFGIYKEEGRAEAPLRFQNKGFIGNRWVVAFYDQNVNDFMRYLNDGEIIPEPCPIIVLN